MGKILYRYSRLVFVADDGEFKSLLGRPSADIFLFAGIGFNHECINDIEHSFALLKNKYGLPSHAPVKYNLRDTKIKRWYADHSLSGCLEALFHNFDEFRSDAYQILTNYESFSICTARKGWLEVQTKKPKKGKAACFRMEAFTNILQRLGMLARYNLTTHLSPRVTVVIDNPSSDVKQRIYRAYKDALNTGHSGYGCEFTSGPLINLGFATTLETRKTISDPLLQLTDILTGIVRDFLDYCFDPSCGTEGRVNKYFQYMHNILHYDDDYTIRYCPEFKNTPINTGLHISPAELCKLAFEKYETLIRLLNKE